MKETPKVRDLIALPLIVVGIIFMFSTLPIFALASTIGGRWTARTIIKMYGK